MRTSSLLLVLGALAICPTGVQAALPVSVPERERPVDFQQEILPMLKANCLACHNRTRARADLILESPASILRGGASGPAVVPGRPEESLMYLAAAHLDPDAVMPPEDNGANARNLDPEELGLLQLWIRQGAGGEVSDDPDPDWHPVHQRLRSIYAASLTSSGRFAAFGPGSRAVVYDVFLQRLAARLEDPALEGARSHLDMVNAIDFSPSGEWIATGGFREVKLWQRELPIETLILPGDPDDTITAVARSTDRLHLALGWASGRVLVRHLPTGETTLEERLEPEPVRRLALSADGRFLLAIQGERRLRGFDAKQATRPELPPEAAAAAFARGSTRLALVTSPREVELWRSNAESLLVRERTLEQPGITEVLALGHGRKAVLGLLNAEGRLLRIDWESGKVLEGAEATDPVPGVHAGGEASWALATTDGRLGLWRAEDPGSATFLRGEQRLLRQVEEGERSLRLAEGAVSTATDSLDKADKGVSEADARVKKAEEDLKGKRDAENEAAGKLEAARKANGEARAAVVRAGERLQSARQRVETAEAEVAERTGELRQAVAAGNGEAIDAAVAALVESAAATGIARSERERITAQVESGEEDRTKAVEDTAKAVAGEEGNLEERKRIRSLSEEERRLAGEALDRARAKKTGAEGRLEEARTRREEADRALESVRGRLRNRPFAALDLSPDGDRLAALEPDGELHVWQTSASRLLDTVSLGEGDWIGLAFLTDRSLLAVASSGEVRVVSLDGRWTLRRTLGKEQGFAGRVNALDFSRNGRWLAAGGGEPSRSGEILIWDMDAMEPVALWDRLHSDVVFGLEFSPDDALLASGSADRFVRVVDLARGSTLRSFEGHTHYVLDVSWQADGRVLASAGGNGEVKLWDVVAGTKRLDFEGLDREVVGVGFLGEGDEVLASSSRSPIAVYNLDGRQLRTLEAPRDTVFAEAVSDDGRYAAAGGRSGILRIWDARSGRTLVTVDAGD